ncbi:hypothetical protein CHUAL_007182 [Chamberlinius hualienensis]
MTVDFTENFWGEKSNGFEVLYHNMKYGQVASKELTDFFKERLSIEENQSKALAKLAKQAGNNCTNGTFAPIWKILKVSSEKQSTAHSTMVLKFQELIKEIAAYSDSQQKRHKIVKEEESSTLEAVQSIHSTKASLLKAKEIYMQRVLEVEKMRKENSTIKDIEKADVKCQKACEDYKTLIKRYSTVRENFEKRMVLACRHFQEVEENHLRHMKSFLTKFGEVLQMGHALIGQVHREYTEQCQEATVVKLLEEFVNSKTTGRDIPEEVDFENVDGSSLNTVSQSPVGNETPLTGTASTSETTSKVEEKSNSNGRSSRKEGNKLQTSAGRKSKSSRRTTSLLNLFLPSHGNAKDVITRPDTPKTTEGTSEENCDNVRNSPTVNGNLDTGGVNAIASDPVFGRNTFRGSKWLWKGKNKGDSKTKEKKAKKKKGEAAKEEISEKENDEQKGNVVSSPSLDIPEVDEEGYSVRPEPVKESRGSYFSSSDSDSEEEKEVKIHIQIKPLTNGSAPLSASIDELRASVGGLSLSPIGQQLTGSKSPVSEMECLGRRSVPITQKSRPVGGDLLNFGNSSSASTPTGGYSTIQNTSSSDTEVHSPSTASDPPSSGTTPTPTHSDEVSDTFSELLDLPPALPPKQQNAISSISGTSNGTVIPRPPSRRALEGPSVRGRMSPLSPINRADSMGSLSSEFRTSSMSVGSSRGPSPLTIGMSDIIPIAVAFQEIAHAYFKGTEESRCMVKLSGDMMLSFPAGIVQVLTNNPSPAALIFRVRNISKMESIVPNKQLITIDENQSSSDYHVYEFNMPALTTVLRWQQEQNPSASYFNVDILKYQMKTGSGAQSAPLHLVCYWKCENQFTDLRLDYKYNGSAMTASYPLLNIAIYVPVDGGVTAMQAKPNGQWIPESHRALWRFTELSRHSDNDGSGSLRARFDLSNGPSSPGTIAAQFACEGTTLSGADFELVGLGYRVSLIKRRVITGKYICEAEPDMRFRYAPPPGV